MNKFFNWFYTIYYVYDFNRPFFYYHSTHHYLLLLPAPATWKKQSMARAPTLGI